MGTGCERCGCLWFPGFWIVSDSYPNAYSDPYQYAYSHEHINAYANWHKYTSGHQYPDSYPNAHEYTPGNEHAYAYVNSNASGNRYVYTDTYQYAILYDP